MLIFAPMKRRFFIGLVLLLTLSACHSPQREARLMVRRAEWLADTLPDSTAHLIDSVLRMPVYFNERQRMDMALLQAEALFGDHGVDISPLMDDDFFDDHANLTTSPELERAAAYYAKKKKYDKAAHAALYSGFVQQHYGDKTAAMQSCKDAEHFGGLAGDSLAVARGEYWMGKMLLDEGMEREALTMLQTANHNFGNLLIDKAMVQNTMAVCYMMLGDFENAELCLKQGLTIANKNNSKRQQHRIWNNHAVLNRLQGKYNQSLEDLRVIEKEMDSTETPFLYLNKAIVFVAMNDVDSATLYFFNLKPFLLLSETKDLTKASAYDVLSNFAKDLGNDSMALQYRETHEKLLFEIMQQRQEQKIYRIQHQYDYESLQNETNRKLILKQRFITIISIMAVIALTFVALSQIRLAKIRKQEAEAKANLFHFMQQNKEYENTCQDYAEKFSNAKNREQKIILKMAIFLKNQGELSCLDELKRAIFCGQTPWEATFKIFDTLYPNVRENLILKHPELSEMEQKVFILSFFGVSRQDEADMLGTTIHTVDKLRNSVRKKLRETLNEA